jgi:hypothetical protein
MRQPPQSPNDPKSPEPRIAFSGIDSDFFGDTDRLSDPKYLEI